MKKLLAVMLCVLALLLSFIACDKQGGDNTVSDGNKATWQPKPFDKQVSSSTLSVEKVENLSQDFIIGMDASSVISLESAGVKYYDYDGVEQDVFKTLSENGVNYIRVRVWNDPFDANGNGYGGGNCNIDTAVAIGKRATRYGMKLLINFHYSDFWADPGKQFCPKAWAKMSYEEKTVALKNYTTDCLNKLKVAGVDVGMVQIGNETNGNLAGEKTWDKICGLIKAGAEGVREVYPGALVVVHFTNPEKVTNYYEYAERLSHYGVDYDVFASSYYPYWHGTLENLSNLLSYVATTYDKKVMVSETSYCYTGGDTDFYGNTISSSSNVVKPQPFTVQGQANSIRDVINCVANLKNGIGVFYWEGTWISTGGNSWEENRALWENYGTGWASSYSKEYDPDDAGKYYGGNAVDNQALFDKHGSPLESLKVFALVGTGTQNA